MKKPGVVLLALVLALTTVSLVAYAAPAPTPSQTKQVFNWRMQTHHPPNSTIGESSDMFAKDVERLSGGRLKIAKMDAGALVPNADIFKGVRTGMIEMGWSDPGYHVGFIPEGAIGTAPFMFQRCINLGHESHETSLPESERPNFCTWNKVCFQPCETKVVC